MKTLYILCDSDHVPLAMNFELYLWRRSFTLNMIAGKRQKVHLQQKMVRGHLSGSTYIPEVSCSVCMNGSTIFYPPP